MLTDAISRLRICFANIPMKGLFFWESLLFLKDTEYQNTVEKSFIKALHSFPKDEQDTTETYQKILKDLQIVREGINKDPQIRGEVEKIREALIAEAAYATIINTMKENLSKQKK